MEQVSAGAVSESSAGYSSTGFTMLVGSAGERSSGLLLRR